MAKSKMSRRAATQCLSSTGIFRSKTRVTPYCIEGTLDSRPRCNVFYSTRFYTQSSNKITFIEGLRRPTAFKLVLFQSHCSKLPHIQFSIESVQLFYHEVIFIFFLKTFIISCCNQSGVTKLIHKF